MISRKGLPPYWFTVFLGAFLLFAVQLVLGKYLLPWFGGTPAMWTTCMFFFQTLLLAGYAYVHLLTTFSSRIQSTVHSALLLISLMLLLWLALVWHSPLTPDSSWKPRGAEQPVWQLIKILMASAGLPYFVLSSTGPLLQSWFTKTHPAQSPYRLYALSNLASVLALLSYPFAIEPWLSLSNQARFWCLGFVSYLAGCGYCAIQLAKSQTATNRKQSLAPAEDVVGRPTMRKHILWLALAMCACVMFLATTNQICQDIAVVPLLWVLPLSLYLLSLIICFDKPRWYSRKVFHPAFALVTFLACLVLNGWGLANIKLQVIVYSLTLFVCCMVCHGELAQSKPNARYLTSFYLMIALGGALGGTFVGLVAPVLFNRFWEYQIGLWSSALLLFLILAFDRTSWLYSWALGLPAVGLAAALLPAVATLATGGRKALGNFVPVSAVLVAIFAVMRWGRKGENKARTQAVPLFCGVALLILGGTLVFAGKALVQGTIVSSSRNFYGVLTVRDQNPQYPDDEFYSLYHGRVWHGGQFRAETKRTIPTAYYGIASGAGRAVAALRAASSKSKRGLRIGVVGLGIGTLAAYGRPEDYFRFYEVNPDVVRIAYDAAYFTYLRRCLAPVDVIPGDARSSMERELEQSRPQGFDLLVIDAFSGDAIPIHLLTEQAFRIYLDEISRPGGVIAVHVTNTYLDLAPPLSRVAAHFRLKYAFLHADGDGVTTSYNDWVLLSADDRVLNSILTPAETRSSQPPVTHISLWTDDYSNLLQILRK